MVLIDGAVDGGDLALSEGIVERVVDLADRKAEPSGSGAVDDDIGLAPVLLLV